jgi:hypothetical protein
VGCNSPFEGGSRFTGRGMFSREAQGEVKTIAKEPHFSPHPLKPAPGTGKYLLPIIIFILNFVVNFIN